MSKLKHTTPIVLGQLSWTVAYDHFHGIYYVNQIGIQGLLCHLDLKRKYLMVIQQFSFHKTCPFWRLGCFKFHTLVNTFIYSNIFGQSLFPTTFKATFSSFNKFTNQHDRNKVLLEYFITTFLSAVWEPLTQTCNKAITKVISINSCFTANGIRTSKAKHRHSASSASVHHLLFDNTPTVHNLTIIGNQVCS